MLNLYSFHSKKYAIFFDGEKNDLVFLFITGNSSQSSTIHTSLKHAFIKKKNSKRNLRGWRRLILVPWRVSRYFKFLFWNKFLLIWKYNSVEKHEMRFEFLHIKVIKFNFFIFLSLLIIRMFFLVFLLNF